MEKISNFILAVVICCFSISLAVVGTLNFKALYYMDAEKYNVGQYVGLDFDQVKENYDALIDYNSMFFHGELEFPSLAMSDQGKIHFEDVKVIFVGIQIMLIVSAVLLVFGMIYKIKKKQYKFLLYGAITTVVVPLVVGICVSINWDWAFITFHKIAFSNDYWMFDPLYDPVIWILPDAFFMHCAIMIVSIAGLMCLAFLSLYFILKRRVKSL